MKRFINQETVMLITLSLVVLVVMFGATVSWFVGETPVAVENIELSAEDIEDFKVYVMTRQEPDGDYIELNKVGTGDNVNYEIDMNLVDQNNILKKTFAPGAYGKVNFKIVSQSSNEKKYKIRIVPAIKTADAIGNSTSAVDADTLLGLVKSHIKFYAVYDGAEYEDVIVYDNECANIRTEEFGGYTGTVESNETEYMSLYWYWPYEYIDIPKCLEIDDTDGKFYEEFEKYHGKSESECIEIYDWDDTYIGNYVENLIFHFDVETVR